MTQITKLTSLNFRASSYQTPVIPEKTEAKQAENNAAIDRYLENLAMMNAPKVQKVELASQKPVEYKNNLKSMIQNNQSVMMAIVPRTFTAEDLNGDDKITLKEGEKNGTFLSAISRLDELKEDGINTLHILPIHPTGKKNAMGTAGSIYSPAKFDTLQLTR